MNDLPKKGDLIAGKYAVEGVLGQGGMGAVFEVCHRLTGKHFAVKWLLPTLASQSDAVRRFMREAQVAGRVDHPNVVEVYDVGQEGDSFFMVMELLEGEPLGKRLDRVRRLSVEEACRIVIPVMHGLSAAHAAGVIHRDLKPDNVFLCRTALGTEVPKVLDFGISKMNPLQGEMSAGMTRIGLAIGTPQYMSPEQLRGEATVDLRTDIYALGVMLYEMLGGQQPFPGMSFPDLVLNIMHTEPSPLIKLAPGLPSTLVEIVKKAMSRDPATRFQTMEQMGRALVPFAGGLPFAADTGDPTRLSNTRQQRSASQDRLHTPFGTEMDSRDSLGNEDLAFQRQVRGNLPMVAGVGVAAAAVLALGAAAYMLATQGSNLAVLPGIQSIQKLGAADNAKAAGNANTTLGAGQLQPADPQQSPQAQNPPPQHEPREPIELPTVDAIPIGPDLPGDRPLVAPARADAWGTQQHPGGGQGVVDPAGLGGSDVNHIRLGPSSGSRSGSSSADIRRERAERRRAKRAERANGDLGSPTGRGDDEREPQRDDKSGSPRFHGTVTGLNPDEF